MSENITVIGGGLAGLTAAIAAAERGANVTVHEAHSALGGRARTTAPPYRANDGTHAFYADGAPWRFARRARAAQAVRQAGHARVRGAPCPPQRAADGAPAQGARTRRHQAEAQGAGRPELRRRGTEQFGAQSVAAMNGLAGVLTYEADPGRLSAAFMWERVLRVSRFQYPAARYLIGGWGALVDRLAARARELGVRVETGSRVDTLPDTPVIVATTLDAARTLLGDDSLHWPSGRAVLVDVGVERRRGDLFLISDLDEGGFLERYSLPDPGTAPAGHSLLQTAMPLRPGESKDEGAARAERLLDLGVPGWRDRTRWSRTALASGRTGALDLPGTTWRDRPPVAHSDGVYLAGDSVAAPGLLSEVAMNSAVRAAELATARGKVSAGGPAGGGA